jgi:hypothetical protein
MKDDFLPFAIIKKNEEEQKVAIGFFEDVELSPADIVGACFGLFSHYLSTIPESMQNEVENYFFETLEKFREEYHENVSNINSDDD